VRTAVKDAVPALGAVRATDPFTLYVWLVQGTLPVEPDV
jgi:hypothetical protein